ncbi:hypothetical protein MGA5115_02616 [Marinomonas gallaica]|uniref:DUF3885 domain-containing protein n=1 Tax=Marinomonas gallaica TaxID=1806667 RepID=A0A1C3JTR2_9GAMM|nr:DUF3885 domain-containing protein [Marinomonas gallaica]SBT18485.1 hypothetical protein MGA5115_02616 [Marinomonas gallaica]SBT22806.1 hypothetical protein MGA5116_03436 [Marinomonas gallaica]
MELSKLKLEKPLFYNCNIGIRFEIGPESISLWKDSDHKYINSKYFEEALTRALSIFHTVFDKDDSISITYQIYSDGRRKIRKGNYLFKQIDNLKSKKIEFSDHRDIYVDTIGFKRECWRRVTISNLTASDVKVGNILDAMINTDFGIRQPSLPGECFFINHDKGIVLNLYDDRGMDVIAGNKKALNALYKKHNSWILDYDREKIDAVFK